MARIHVDLDAVERLFTNPRSVIAAGELDFFKRRDPREGEPIIESFDVQGIVRSMTEELRELRGLREEVAVSILKIRRSL